MQNRHYLLRLILELRKAAFQRFPLLARNLLEIRIVGAWSQTRRERQLEQCSPGEAVPLQTQHRLFIELRWVGITVKQGGTLAQRELDQRSADEQELGLGAQRSSNAPYGVGAGCRRGVSGLEQFEGEMGF